MWARGLTLLVALAIFAAGASAHAAQLFEIALDTDVDGATGCSLDVDSPSPEWGFEYRVVVEVDPNTHPLEVKPLGLIPCLGSDWQPMQSWPAAAWAVALNGGFDGADVVEVGVPRALLGYPARIRLAASSRSVWDERDAIFDQSTEDLVVEFISEVPALGPWPLGLLTLLFIGGALVLRRHRALRTLVLLLALTAGARAVYAAVLVADGQLADWAGMAPLASDPADDADDPGIDLVGLWAGASGDTLVVRLDLLDLEGLCLSAADLACDGVCGDLDHAGGPDCDGVCDLDDDAASYDCGGVCSEAEGDACEDARCGDGLIQGTEFCDGPALPGASCESLGFSGGSLACRTDCGAYDLSGCSVPANPDVPTSPTAPPALPADTLAPSLYDGIRFLFEASDPIQRGVSSGTIEPHRAAAFRGSVLDTSGLPLSHVRIEVQGQPGLGYTHSRSNGHFDLAVNGGGEVTLHYSKPGYLPAQRTLDVLWGHHSTAPDVVLVPVSSVVTPVSMTSVTGGSAGLQVAVGEQVEDADGSRQGVVAIRAGTSASVQVDGVSVPLESLNLRITEHTVGPLGFKAMPATLPPASAYTYAVSVTADEVPPESHIEFDQPVAFYVDDFIDWPAGTAVPVGTYDYETSRWVPQPNGLVLEILEDAADGSPQINAGSDDAEPGPESAAELLALGIDADEVALLRSRYEPGKKIWRSTLSQLSAIDLNWFSGSTRVPDDASKPNPTAPSPDGENCASGSILLCQSRQLAERIPITGTDLTLRYQSDRVQAAATSTRSIRIAFASTENIPEWAETLHLRIEVAGRVFLPLEDLNLNAENKDEWPVEHTFEWDGLDAFGRPWSGPVKARFSYSYRFTPDFDEYGACVDCETIYRLFGGPLVGAVSTGDGSSGGSAVICPGAGGGGGGASSAIGGPSVGATRVRRNAIEYEDGMWQAVSRRTGTVVLGAVSNEVLGLGGWGLEQYHIRDGLRGEVYLGTGGELIGPAVGRVVFAGGQSDGLPGHDDETDAERAQLYRPEAISFGPSGALYFTEGMRTGGAGEQVRFRRVLPDGTLEDFLPAGWATIGEEMSKPPGLSVSPDDDVYIVGFRDRERVYRAREASPGWEFEQVAGLLPGTTVTADNVWQDGGPVLGRWLGSGMSVVADGAGRYYLLVFHRLPSEIDPKWRIISVGPDGRGRIMIQPAGVIIGGMALRPNGNLIFSVPGCVPLATCDSSFVGRVMEWSAIDATVSPLAGAGLDPGTGNLLGDAEDGGPATEAYLGYPWSVAADPENGSVYVVAHDSSDSALGWQRSSGTVRSIDRSGIVRTVSHAGVPEPGFLDDFGPEPYPPGGWVKDIAVSPDGILHTAETRLHRIIRHEADQGDLDGGDYLLPSGDGEQIFYFSAGGLHLRTDDSVTGETLYRFEHSGTKISAVIDRNGLRTEFDRTTTDGEVLIRSPQSPPPESPEAPALIASTTTLELDENGYAQKIEDPTGAHWTFEYDEGGPLTRAWDPRANAAVPQGQPSVYSWREGGANEPGLRLEWATDQSGASQTFSIDIGTESSGSSSGGGLSGSGIEISPVMGNICGATYIASWQVHGSGGAGSPWGAVVTRTTHEGRSTDYISSKDTYSSSDANRSQRSSVFGHVVEPSGRTTCFVEKSSDVCPPTTAVSLLPEGRTVEVHGEISRITQVKDPRLGSSARRVTERVVTLPVEGGRPSLERSETINRSYAMVGSPITGVTSYPDTLVVNGDAARTWITDYDVGSRTATTTPPSDGGGPWQTEFEATDRRARPKKISPPGQVPMEFEYDALGRVTRVSRTLEVSEATNVVRETRLAYDERGFLNQVTTLLNGAEESVTHLTNDLRGAPLVSTLPGAREVAITRDASGNILTLAPPDRDEHALAYTDRGRLEEVTPPGVPTPEPPGSGGCDPGKTCYEYTPDRQLKKVTRADETTVDYVYDTAGDGFPSSDPEAEDSNTGLLRSKTIPGRGAGGVGTLLYSYDDQGRLAALESPEGGSLTYAYHGRYAVREVSSGTHAIADPDGGPPIWSGSFPDARVEREFDDLLNVEWLDVNAGWPGYRHQIVRDSAEQLEQIAPGPGWSVPPFNLDRSPIDGHINGTSLCEDGSCIKTTLAYDVGEASDLGFGDLQGLSASIELEADSSSELLFSVTYERDGLGRITEMIERIRPFPFAFPPGADPLEDLEERRLSYTYDAAGRLHEVRDNDPSGSVGLVLESYEYDENGNRTAVGGSTLTSLNLGSDLGCEDEGDWSASDEQDRLCRYGDYTYAFSASGNLQTRTHTDGTTTEYHYAADGALTRVSIGGDSIHYVRAAGGRRIAKLSDAPAGPPGTYEVEKGWVYGDQLNPVGQLGSDGWLEATFVYGTRDNIPDFIVHYAGGPTTTYRIISDHLGSPRLVVKVATGEVVHRMDFDAFGNVTGEWGDTTLHPFGFAGGLYDRDTGLTRFGARDYDPVIGRWTAKDPILFAGGDTNLYAYVGNDPVNLIDPTGKNPLVVAAVAVWAVGVGALYLYETDFLTQPHDGSARAVVFWTATVAAFAAGGWAAGLVVGAIGVADWLISKEEMEDGLTESGGELTDEHERRHRTPGIRGADQQGIVHPGEDCR